jgi:hypothetical protein
MERARGDPILVLGARSLPKRGLVMTRNVGRVVSHGVVRAFTKKVSLGLAGVTATSALLLQSWHMFAASMIGYVAMVAFDLGRSTFWRQTVREVRRQPPGLPSALEFRDDTARDFIHRITSARAERGRVLDPEPTLPDRLSPQLETLVQLETRALALVARMEELSRFLSERNLAGMRDDRARLERAAANAPGPLRAEYEKACAALDADLGAVHEILDTRDYLAARVEVAVRMLEMFPAQVARMRALDADMLQGADDLERDLDPRALVVDVSAADEVLSRARTLGPALRRAS